ncbi:traB domain-containing protein-like [Zingiber officinale]|uniref:traB domain-containing protein-like n=1 Tax=Zingiber officinale TaxID=94328 RepID=UPI001C4AA70E|nr:traB domain-containing protein-like [Zingiber officinale]
MFTSARVRLLNSAESLLVPPIRCPRHGLTRYLPPLRRLLSIGPRPPPRFSASFCTSSYCLRPPMDPAGSASAGSDPFGVDDYVHVSKSSSNEAALYLESERSETFDSDLLPGAAEGRSSEVEPDASGLRLGEQEGSETAEKRVLPEKLAKGVVFLECESSAEGGSCDVYLVGTAHVSQESCKEVQAIISCLKPQVVFLELCASRVAILAPQNFQVPTMSEMIDMWKKKKMNTFGILYSWFLAKVAHKLEVLPGAEFRIAYEETMGYGGKIILGDRPVHITLKRTWGKMSLWARTKFLFNILFQTVFLPSTDELNKMLKDMDNVDMLTLVIQEMSKAFPTLMDTLLHERDMYMSSTLLKVAREHSSVVAVVGKGHLAGIKKNWKQPIEMKHLLEVPVRSAGPTRKTILASVAVGLTGIAAGVYLLAKR